jgi:hypothetical protein
MAFPRPQVFAGLIQSSFGDTSHRNFEAVVMLANYELWHYWRDNSAAGNQTWKPGARICAGAAYAGSLIQSHFKKADPSVAGNFEVVVPLTVNGHVQLTHFWRDNSTTANSPWQLGAPVTVPTDQVLGPGCIIQSSFGSEGNFEVIVPIVGPDGHAVLQHYWRDDPSNPKQPWQRALQVTQPRDIVTGPGCIIQSTRGNRDIHIVVPIMGTNGKPQLRHISRSGATGPWVTNAASITRPGDEVAGGAVIIESDFGDGGGDHNNFEVLVGLRMPTGNIEVRHFWHDTSDSPTWTCGQRVTASASDTIVLPPMSPPPDPFAASGLALIQSDYPKGGPHGDFEALIAQGTQWIGSYARFNESATPQWAGGWVPHLPLPEEPHTDHFGVVSKVCQLIGESDLEGWSSRVVPNALSSTGTALAVTQWSEIDGSINSSLIVAWANAAKNPIQLASTADADTFALSPPTTDFTDAAPALAACNGQVFMAWKGAGNQQLNIAALNYHNDNGWSGPPIGTRIEINGLTDAGPALAAHGNGLALAWKAVGTNELNVAFWQPGSTVFGNTVPLGEVTLTQPALISHNNQLFVAWTGSDNHVNVAVLPDGGSSVTAKIPLPETTTAGPSLATFKGSLLVAFADNATQRMTILSSNDNGQHFDGRPRLPPRTTRTSGLAAGPDVLFCAFTEEVDTPFVGPLPVPVEVGRFIPPANWTPMRPFGTAFNRTETTARIMGTDLGNQFMHDDGRMCFLFGDTAHSEPDPNFNLDTIAFADVKDFDPHAGLPLTFNPQPPIIAGMRGSQTVYSVPLDGISLNGAMYLFYSLDSVALDPGYTTFGHTDVVKSVDNGLNFTHLYRFSADRFLNVSIAQVKGTDLGMPNNDDMLAVWGTGTYHSSEPFLAALPLSSIESGHGALLYAGTNNGSPVWVDKVDGNEDAAAPLFQDPSLAELCVRFNPYLNAWMMTYTSLTVAGVCLRLSATPWGPWTTPLRLLDLGANGADYVHTAQGLTDGTRRDWMYDVGMPVPGDPTTTPGIVYSPAIIEPLTQVKQTNGFATTVFFTMSTWSPYTSLLMSAYLDTAALPAVVGPFTDPVPPPTADQMIAALAAVNIGFSVDRAKLVSWLNDPQNTPYPALVHALLAMLAGRRLRLPTNIDVIAFFYVDPTAMALPIPHSIAEVNLYALQYAVVDASNDNQGPDGEQVASFRELLAAPTGTQNGQPTEPK